MTTSVHITPPPLSPQSIADLLCTIVLLCRGENTHGNAFWAYMCIKPSMAEAFKIARDKGSFNLEEYGTIIEAGTGSDVPADVAKRMEEDFGVKHDYEDQLLKTIDTLKRRYTA
jgi:hypothetical protein